MGTPERPDLLAAVDVIDQWFDATRPKDDAPRPVRDAYAKVVTAWATVRGDIRRPKRVSESILIPLSEATLAIAKSVQHAEAAMDALGKIQNAHRTTASMVVVTDDADDPNKR